ncbi:MAG: 23S rRNA (guanosine(2251)-2'-O)-methyltransferase RlmB [Acidobacteriota bacterium]
MIIYGINPVAEAFRRKRRRPTRLFITRGKSGHRLQGILEQARAEGISVRFEAVKVLTAKARTSHHQDIVAEIAEADRGDVESLLASRPRLLLLADGVEDPQNLGAVIRTAEAAGVEGILLPDRRSCGVTAAVVKSSAGAALHLPTFQIGNVVRFLKRLKGLGFWVVGLDMLGPQRPEEVKVDLPLVLVVGGEHRGLRTLVRRHCDFLVSLPMFGKMSSLNLSVAAGIVLYQIVLRREKLTGARRSD